MKHEVGEVPQTKKPSGKDGNERFLIDRAGGDIVRLFRLLDQEYFHAKKVLKKA